MLIVVVAAYAFGDPERNKQGERNKTLILAACALGTWDTSKIPKKGAENAERSIWEPGLKTVGVTQTHTHTNNYLSLMTDL